MLIVEFPINSYFKSFPSNVLHDFCPLLVLFSSRCNRSIIILKCAARQISGLFSVTAVVTDLNCYIFAVSLEKHLAPVYRCVMLSFSVRKEFDNRFIKAQKKRDLTQLYT